jgi:hypothetical protein
MSTLDGKSDYELIFIPWFWQDEYEREPEVDTKLTEEEDKYAELHLSEYSKERQVRKLLWRRAKIAKSNEFEFMREYPATPQEAFRMSGASLISPERILTARKRIIAVEKSEPLLCGLDPSGMGKDRTVFAFRRGRKFLSYKVYDKKVGFKPDPMELAGLAATYIDNFGITKMFIDIAYGDGAVSRLKELGYSRVVIPVHFGEAALQSDIYLNKRAEMWCLMAEWFDGDVQIPDDDVLHAELACMPDVRETSSHKKYLEKKEKIRELFKKSPDIGDAFALTFAYPVFSPSRMGLVVPQYTNVKQNKAPLFKSKLSSRQITKPYSEYVTRVA